MSQEVPKNPVVDWQGHSAFARVLRRDVKRAMRYTMMSDQLPQLTSGETK